MANKKKEGARKKEEMKKVEEARKQKKMMFGAAVIAIALIGLGMGFSFMGGDGGQSPYSNPPETTESEVFIPVSDITTTAKYFRDTIDGVTVKYFVVEGEDGEIHTAFDACDVCYREKKGYSQEGSNMICNNCGNQYPTNCIGTQNSAGGGCWPGYLKTSFEGDNLVISKTELTKGTYYFE